MVKQYWMKSLSMILILGLISTLGYCDMSSENEHKLYVEEMFKKYPQIFPEDRRKFILKGIVTKGMTPFEAKLAGGEFFYSVKADQRKWPKNSDPLKVMWAQSMQPDDSEIWMTFKNNSQFMEQGKVSFRVYFKQGTALKIEKLSVK